MGNKIKRGLTREKGLKINKKAGYMASRRLKRDRAFNKRAGLHDKKKDLQEGESRIYRCKPLAIKHKRRIRKVVLAFCAVLVAGLSYIGLGFLVTKENYGVEELNNATVCYETPTDGSLPTEHTLVENVGYLNYTLQQKESWSSSMSSTVHTIMEQHVYTHKKKYEDKIISADMATGASNTARQFCVSDEYVLWREANGKIDINSMDSEWSDGKPYGHSIERFRRYRGLPPSEFSVYILNELTVKNAEEKTVKDNGDGTYTMTLDLNVHQSGLDSAVHYYKQQMLVTGGLYDWPTFEYTYVTYVFTADWTLLEFSISDKYSAKMGAISAGCTSDSRTVFDYDEKDAVNEYYNDYFKKYDNATGFIDPRPDMAPDPDAATCLSGAFGSVLTDGAVFKADFNISGRPLEGKVYVGIDSGNFNDLRVALGSIGVYLDGEGGKKSLYINVGKDKLKVNLDAFAAGDAQAVALAEEAQGGENESATKEQLLDLDALMEQIFGGEFKFDETSASLKSTIEVFGLKVNLDFEFNIDKEGKVSLNYVDANLNLNGSPISAHLKFGTEADIPAELSSSEKAQYTDVLQEGLTLGINAAIGSGNDKFALDGAVRIELEGGAFKGVSAVLGDKSIYYVAESGTLYMNLGENAAYKLDISKLNLGGAADGLSQLDLGSLIPKIIGGLTTDGSGISFDSGDLFGQMLHLALNVNLSGKLQVSANAELEGKEISAVIGLGSSVAIPELGNTEKYVDLLNGEIDLNVQLGLDELTLEGVVGIVLENGALKEVKVNLAGGGLAVYYDSSESTIYLSSGNDVKVKLNINALNGGNAPSTQSAGAFDLKQILGQIIENLKGTQNGISTGLTLTLPANSLIGETQITANVAVDILGGIGVNANAELFGKKVTLAATLGGTAVPELSDKESYVDLLNGEIDLNVQLGLDELTLDGVVGIVLENGALKEVKVNLAGGGLAVYYDSTESTVYVSSGNDVKVKLNINALNAGSTPSAQSESAFDFKQLIGQIIENLKGTQNGVSTGLTLTLPANSLTGETEITADVAVDILGGIGVKANAKLFGKKVTLAATLGGTAVPELTDAEKDGYADIFGDVISLSGKISVDVGGTLINLDISELTLKLTPVTADGATKIDFEFALKSQITVSDTLLDIFVSYTEGKVTLVYGAEENQVGVCIDVAGGDLQALEAALVDVYNRVAAVLDEIILNSNIEQVETLGQIKLLDDILKKLGLGDSAAKGIDQILEMLGITGEGKPVDKVLGALKLETPAGGLIGMRAGNLALELIAAGENNPFALNVSLSNSSVNANVSVNSILKANAHASADCDKVLTAADLTDMLDYLAATAELLVEKEYSLDVQTRIYEGADVALDVGVVFEYIQGDGFPVEVTLPEKDENGNEISGLKVNFRDDMYFHLGVGLARNREVASNYTVDESGNKTYKDDLYLDIYILDANPEVAPVPENNDEELKPEAGKTTGLKGGNDTTGGGLDVYLSLSKFPAGNSLYAPIKVYAPVNEILTVLAAGVAVLDLQGIDVSEESKELQSVISTVAKLLDDALVKAKLPYTHSQFESLGSSLIPQILGSDLSTLIKNILKSIPVKQAQTAEPENVPPVPKDPACGNFVKSIGLSTAVNGDRALGIVLNSAAIYGEGYEDITFEAYKNYSYGVAVADADGTLVQGETKSHITGASVKNIYFGGNKKVDLSLAVNREVAKLSDFGGYYDFSGIDTLLKAVINSATHSRNEATDLDKEIYGDKLTDYLLNRYYYLEGKIDLHVPVNSNYQIGLSAAVYIDKNNEVAINASLDIPALQKVMQVVTNGDTHTELSIKEGMVYIKRVQKSHWDSLYRNQQYSTPITIYRVMPISEFTANLMDNIVFILNLGPVVTNNLGNGSGETTKPAEQDFGAAISKYLAYFKYRHTSNSASWTLAINGSCVDFGTNMIGLNNIIVSFNASSRYDELSNSKAYLLSGVNLQTGLSLANILEITVDGNITYCNPQQVMNKAYTDNTVDGSAMWEELFGCPSSTLAVASAGLKEGTEYTADVIAAAERWKKAIASLNASKNYIEVNLSESTGVNLGEIPYYANGEKIGSSTVLYGDSEGLLSVNPVAPEWKDWQGYDKRIDYNGVVLNADGTLSVTDFTNPNVSATYTPKKFNVTVTSDFAQTFTDNIEYVYDTDLELVGYFDGREVEVDGVKYTIVALELNGTRYCGNIDKFNTLQDVTFTAVWDEVDVTREFEVSYVADGKVVETRNVLYGNEIDTTLVPEAPVGYYFDGWDFGGLKEVYSNRIVTAIFKPMTYTVTLNLDDLKADWANYNDYDYQTQLTAALQEAGYTDGKLYYTYGEEAITLNDIAALHGYEFVRYYALEGGEKVTVTEIDMITSDKEIFAEFKNVRLTVEFKSTAPFKYGDKSAQESGGEYSLEYYFYYDGDCGITQPVTDTKIHFFGWYVSGESGYSEVTDLFSAVAPGERVTLEGAWLETAVTATCSKRDYRDGIMQGWRLHICYTITGTVSYQFVGNAQLIEALGLEVTGLSMYGYVNDGETYEENKADAQHTPTVTLTFDENNSASHTFDEMNLLDESSKKKKCHTVAVLTVNFNGKSITVAGENTHAICNTGY